MIVLPSIDYAIRFAKAFGATVNLLHLYQDPYVVSQSSRSPNWDLFKEQRRKVFADFYNLLRETRSNTLTRRDILSMEIPIVRSTSSRGSCAQTS